MVLGEEWRGGARTRGKRHHHQSMPPPPPLYHQAEPRWRIQSCCHWVCPHYSHQTSSWEGRRLWVLVVAAREKEGAGITDGGGAER